MDKNIQLVVLKEHMGITKNALHLDECLLNESALYLDRLPCFAACEMFTNQSLEDIHK